MRKTILTITSCFALLLSAQQVTITKNVPLLKGVENSAYYPVLSEDGQKVLFSSENYKGLKLYDIKDNVVERISGADRAGLYPSFSKDGKVYFVTQQKDGMVNYRSVESFDLKTKATNTIISKERNIMRPQPLKNGVAFKSTKGITNTAKGSDIFVYTEGSKIFICKDGVEKSYSPVESVAGYLWESLSPDKTKVMFYAAGKGIVIMDLNGKVLSMPGKYENPSWYDDEYIVAQNATDDGHQYRSSQILLVKADGSFKKELTTPTSMAMNPTASGKANRVIYNTIDGNLYMMELNIVK